MTPLLTVAVVAWKPDTYLPHMLGIAVAVLSRISLERQKVDEKAFGSAN